jgi:hypothetical protein
VDPHAVLRERKDARLEAEQAQDGAVGALLVGAVAARRQRPAVQVALEREALHAAVRAAHPQQLVRVVERHTRRRRHATAAALLAVDLAAACFELSRGECDGVHDPAPLAPTAAVVLPPAVTNPFAAIPLAAVACVTAVALIATVALARVVILAAVTIVAVALAAIAVVLLGISAALVGPVRVRIGRCAHGWVSPMGRAAVVYERRPVASTDTVVHCVVAIVMACDKKKT